MFDNLIVMVVLTYRHTIVQMTQAHTGKKIDECSELVPANIAILHKWTIKRGMLEGIKVA